MSDESKPNLNEVYFRSAARMRGEVAEPEPEIEPAEEYDEATYNRLIAEGRTEEYAREMATHETMLKQVYRKSRLQTGG